jgi:hypothetical protein
MWRVADRRGAILREVHVNYIVDLHAGDDSKKEAIGLIEEGDGRKRNAIYELSAVMSAIKRRQLGAKPFVQVRGDVVAPNVEMADFVAPNVKMP